MADHTIDAFLYFGTTAATGKAGKVGGPLPSGGLDGETSDKYATGKDELKGFSWPLELHGYKFGFELDKDWARTGANSEDPDHRPKLAPLVIRKQFDMASPKLLEAIDQVSVFEEVKLVHRRSGGGLQPQVFFIAEMKTVVIQALDWETRDDGVIMETVQLDFCGITAKYIPQLSKGGDDSDNRVSYQLEIEFPKDDRDRTRSFLPPERTDRGDDRATSRGNSAKEVMALRKGNWD